MTTPRVSEVRKVVTLARVHKILMLIENASVPLDNRVWAEAVALREHGFEVSIVGPKGPSMDKEPYICIEGIHVYRYGLPAVGSSAISYILEYGITLLMSSVLSFWVWVRHGFDVIHAANPPDLFFLLGLFYRLFGKRFVYDQHDLAPEMLRVKFGDSMWPLYRLLLFFEWCSYRTADIVITPNFAVKRFAVERGRFPADKVFVVYNGPDLKRIRKVLPEPELKAGRPFLLAYVGAIEVQDGVEHTLYALDDLVHKRGRQDASLVLIGDGGYLPALRTLSHELQLDEYVHFTGWLVAEDVVRYLTVADVGLTPEPANGLNEYCTMVKTMEYMALEKPVVAFDLAETRLSAQDAVLYATPNEAVDFASKVETLLDDEALRRTMGAIGRKRIEEELSWDHAKKNLVRAYKELV